MSQQPFPSLLQQPIALGALTGGALGGIVAALETRGSAAAIMSLAFQGIVAGSLVMGFIRIDEALRRSSHRTSGEG